MKNEKPIYSLKNILVKLEMQDLDQLFNLFMEGGLVGEVLDMTSINILSDFDLVESKDNNFRLTRKGLAFVTLFKNKYKIKSILNWLFNFIFKLWSTRKK